MAEQTEDTATYLQNPDGTYTALPPGAVGENGEVLMNLNELGIANEGEEMVVIAADDNFDVTQLETLIQSGAYTTVQGEDGTEYLQLADQNGLDGTPVIGLTPEQLQYLDPDTKAMLSSQGLIGPNVNFVSLGGGNAAGTTYRCPSCPAMYANANAFTKHMREKHFVKVYTCRQCEEFFETLSQLFLHARRSHVDPKKPKRNPANYKFHCDQCTYMTNNGGTMEHHKRAHTGEKPFVCDVCGKRFAQKANMKTHRNRHIHRDKIFRCDTCNKAFSSYDIYLAHLRTREHELREHFAMMATSQLSLECLGCAANFDSIYNLNKHTRSCRIVRTLQTKFRCLPCNAYVSDVASLKAHVKAHEGSQIISCPVCGERGFPGFNQLNHHITRAHALKVNRRHVCRYCESTFELKKDLDSHIKSMHAEERNARQSRGAVGRLKCRYSYCEFTTNSIMLLDRHHEQHRRQEEDGEDIGLSTMDYTGFKKRRRGPMQRRSRMSDYESEDDLVSNEDDELESDNSDVTVSESDGDEDEDEYSISETDEEKEEDEEATPLTGVDEDGNVVRRTITLYKTGCKKKKHPLGHDMKHYGGYKRHRDEMKNLDDSGPSRRMSRARRLPAWYKDYDTDFATNEEMDREQLQAQLPPGLELEDPEAGDPSVPTEEWNIVVYDDEEEEEEQQNQIYATHPHLGMKIGINAPMGDYRNAVLAPDMM